MATWNITLVDKHGQTLKVRGAKTKKEGERYLNKEAVNRDLQEPYFFTSQKMK